MHITRQVTATYANLYEGIHVAQQLTIPERLDWLLRQRGMSQNALARVANVSPQTIANTLRHGRVPQVRTTQRWARALGVPTSFFSTRPMTEDQLLAVVERAGAYTTPGTGKAGRTNTPTTRKATTVKKSTTGSAKRSTPATKKTTAAKRPAPASRAASAKGAASRTTSAKPKVASGSKGATKAKGSATVKAKPAATTRATSTTKVVRHATKGRAGSVAARSNGNGSGTGLGIDRDTLLKKLVKLTSSREDAVALDATKTLLTLVK